MQHVWRAAQITLPRHVARSSAESMHAEATTALRHTPAGGRIRVGRYGRPMGP